MPAEIRALLGVSPGSRGRGGGERLMTERPARDGDLIGLRTDTDSFRAPGLYRRPGFEEVGRIPDDPPGQARLFLPKRLDGRPVREAAPDRPVHEGTPR